MKWAVREILAAFWSNWPVAYVKGDDWQV